MSQPKKPVSEKQLAANRSNAAHSSGPPHPRRQGPLRSRHELPNRPIMEAKPNQTKLLATRCPDPIRPQCPVLTPPLRRLARWPKSLGQLRLRQPCQPRPQRENASNGVIIDAYRSLVSTILSSDHEYYRPVTEPRCARVRMKWPSIYASFRAEPVSRQAH